MAEPTILTVDDYVEWPAVPATARYTYGADPAHFGDLYVPAQGAQHPVIVLIHGGCWRAQYALEPLGRFCEALVNQGVAVWNLEYRRLGNGGGWPNTLLDVAAGVDYVRTLAGEYSLDLNRVVAAGHSAGGHLALWLAARHRLPATSPLATPAPLPLTGAVALAGIPDLVDAAERNICRGAVPELLGGAAVDVPFRYRDASPSAFLPLGVPQHLIIGTRDQAVPLVHNENYVAAARRLGDRVTLTVLPAIGHFEIVTPESTVWPTVQEAILTLLHQRG
ncbi:MAG: alpha/beta hydrolase [Caldilineaceae bacterium]